MRNLTLQFVTAFFALGCFTASFTSYVTHRDLHSFPTRRSSDLTSSFAAGANAITLTQATNSFTGAVTLSNSGANDVALTNNTATVLGSSVIGRNLTVTEGATGGSITQTGALTVGGTSSVTAGAH